MIAHYGDPTVEEFWKVFKKGNIFDLGLDADAKKMFDKIDANSDGYISKDAWGLEIGQRLLELYKRRRAAIDPSYPESPLPREPRRER